ncbi:MAG: hypothetical protein P4L31_01315 [Candidatus Babeliales bacterium]|nr:hypothetical protein [Candidatus Babeliales bacterium]
MIDTIALTLTKDMFHISDPEAFTPSADWAVSNKSQRGMQSRQNPTKAELNKGIYKPHLTLAHRINEFRKREIMLKIELSLPKLIYGNNFAELRFKDFDTIAQKLVATLKTMGIITTLETISQATVSAVHYSKNICLTDGSTPHSYINKIKEANVSLSLDVNQTDYRNDGHSYKWHANSYEVAFYDKIIDLEKAKTSSKRSIEKDNELQLSLAYQLQKRRTMFEVLRMEVRLNKRAKIKQLFKKLDIKAELTFKKLFKPAISKKVLLHYLDEVEAKRPKLLDYKATSGKALFSDLMFNNPDLGAKQIWQIYGFKMALDTMNIRELRNMHSRFSERTWLRLMADVNKVNLPRAQSPFKIIREQLNKFEALKMPKQL